MGTTPKENILNKKYYVDFSGGNNSFVGPRQIKDNESPDSANCDFMGKGGIGNRQGYEEIQSPTTYTSGIKGMGQLHTASIHQLLAFKTNGANVVLSYSVDGSTWTNYTTDTFQNRSISGCQAHNNFYIGNGADTMKHWTGTAWVTTTNGTPGYFPTDYGQRLWVIDETYPDRLNFSGVYSDQLLTGGALKDKYADFSDATAGWIALGFGTGEEIVGLRSFKNALYVLCRNSVWSLTPHSSTADSFIITKITTAVGCVSAKSIAQVGEDIFFAADDGVYSLGDVANYAGVIRSTVKSGRIEKVFTAMTAQMKANLVGVFYGFKYHLFYSVGGTVNDSCYVYDTRYGGWLNWTNMSAHSALVYRDSNNATSLVFGHPTTSSVYTMYSGATDAGTAISSYWYSKSFDYELSDVTKLFMDSTFLFGGLNGTVTVSTIFNDFEVSSTKSISQARPQGGMGRDKFGLMPFGDSTNTLTIVNFVGQPLRMRARGQKFAIQYKVSASSSWRLDGISQTYIPFSHYKFNSLYKIS